MDISSQIHIFTNIENLPDSVMTNSGQQLTKFEFFPKNELGINSIDLRD